MMKLTADPMKRESQPRLAMVRVCLVLVALGLMVVAEDRFLQARQPANSGQAEQEAQTTERMRELEELVQMLAAPSYRKRELAMRKLIDAGREAIPPLEAAMRDGNLELVDRASSILQDLALVETPEDEGVAWKALERLQQNGPGAASTRAYSSLTLIRRERIKRAQAKLSAAGIQVGLQIYQLGNESFSENILLIDERWNGSPEVFDYFPWLYGTQMAWLKGAAVNREMLRAIAKLPAIKELRLHDGKLTAEGLRELKQIKRLDLLELHFVEIGNGDEDLFALAEMPVRREMIVTGTDFEQEDYEALKVERDDLEITFSEGGFLGVQCTPSSPTCYVNDVVRDGAAQRAGILPGDVIIQLGDYEVKKFEDLQAAVRKYRAGEEVEVKLLRSEKELTLKVVLGRLEQ